MYPLKNGVKPKFQTRNQLLSNTYQARFAIAGEKTLREFTYISIPFKEKEATLTRQFGITAFAPFFNCLEKHLDYEIELFTYIANNASEDVVKNITEYKLIEKDEEEKDYYFITSPHTAFLNSHFMKDGVISYQNLLNLAQRLITTIKYLDKDGIRLGAIDLESLVLREDELSGREFIEISSLLYAYKDGDELLPPLSCMPRSTAKEVLQGATPTLQTDLISLAGLLWALANEKSYYDMAEIDSEPANIPGDFKTVIRRVLKREKGYELASFLKDISQLRKTAQQENIDFNITLAESTKAPVNEENAKEPNIKESEKETREKKAMPKSEDDGFSRTTVLDEPKTDMPMLIEVETGEVTHIDKSVFTIGISKRCDLRIDQDKNSHTVSRVHATIFIKNDTVYIKDESSNGTFIKTENGAFTKIPKGNEVELKNNQYLRFADIEFKYVAEREA